MVKPTLSKWFLGSAAAVVLIGASAAQQKPAEEDAEGLQKATQNPVASLISVPLQNNSNFDIGPLDRTQDVLNIQPVIPMRVSKNWNLIARIITPLIYRLYKVPPAP